MTLSGLSTPDSPKTWRDRAYAIFRGVAFFEGLTSIALFCVAMPMKYIWDMPQLIFPAGAIHGYAWIAYVVLMVVALWGRGWSAPDWGRTFLAGLIPLGTFFNDPFLKRRQHEAAA